MQNKQIHKYTNTTYDEVPERPNMWYVFEKGIVQGYQKLYSHVSNDVAFIASHREVQNIPQ